MFTDLELFSYINNLSTHVYRQDMPNAYTFPSFPYNYELSYPSDVSYYIDYTHDNYVASKNHFTQIQAHTETQTQTQTQTQVETIKSKKNELWGPVKEWISSYRCQVCHSVMSKKYSTKYPQRVYACGHIMCNSCIINSYLVELKHYCPVEGCNIFVNPKWANTIENISKLSIKPSIPDYITCNQDNSYNQST